jgi:DNA-binding GntR family transcriptional regulator
MRPGIKLNLAKLANELSVSRTTVRDAVLMLTEEHLINKTPDNKFYISELKTTEMKNIYAARKMIESGAAQILCELITKEQIQIFHSILDNMHKSINVIDYDEFSKLDMTFHKNIVTFCENEFVILMYDQILDQINRYINYTSFNDYPNNKSPFMPMILRQHSMIVHSLEHGMPENAAYLIHKHFTDAEKLLLHPQYHLPFKE